MEGRAPPSDAESFGRVLRRTESIGTGVRAAIAGLGGSDGVGVLTSQSTADAGESFACCADAVRAPLRQAATASRAAIRRAREELCAARGENSSCANAADCWNPCAGRVELSEPARGLWKSCRGTSVSGVRAMTISGSMRGRCDSGGSRSRSCVGQEPFRAAHGEPARSSRQLGEHGARSLRDPIQTASIVHEANREKTSGRQASWDSVPIWCARAELGGCDPMCASCERARLNGSSTRSTSHTARRGFRRLRYSHARLSGDPQDGQCIADIESRS
jgi:hypothetical protein